MGSDPLVVLAVLALAVAVAEWLARRTLLRHLGTSLLVIVLAAVAANAGLIPTGSEPVAIYDAVFSVVAPFAIFLLLLGVTLRDVVRAGPGMLGLFLLGAAGTVAGVVAGLAAVDLLSLLGDRTAALGGMFVATYVGGSLNFNAVALHHGILADGALYTGAVAVDSIMTSVWMVATIALPRLLRFLPGRARPDASGVAAARRAAAGAGAVPPVAAVAAAADAVVPHADVDDAETAGPLDLALLLALAAASQLASTHAAAWLRQATGGAVALPPVLLLTGLALLLAQVPAVRRLRGARLLGMTGVYLFLAVVGACCDLGSLQRMGALGPALFAFVAVVVLVHGALVFGAAWLLRLDLDVAAVASQANIGGGSSALALARSLGRADLVLPGILAGSLGTALGTFLGFAASDWLLSP